MNNEENEIKINKFKNIPKILSLDVSSKTIGVALFDITGSELLELTHIAPKIKPEPEDKLELLIKKSEVFNKFIQKYKNTGIVKVVIEEPLLQSNNIYTVSTLLRYNTLIFKICYDELGVLPNFISTYNARKFAFPDLVRFNDKQKKVLFGGFPKDVDKKSLIWERVNSLFPKIEWQYDKKGKLKKECFDQSDAITCGIGYLNMIANEDN